MMLPNSRYMIYRVMKPETLQAISHAIGNPVMEACRIPGKEYSVYRAWTTTGLCFEMQKAGPRAMQAVRRSEFDREVAA